MNKDKLRLYLIHLYNSYGVDESSLLRSSVDDISKGAKGFLARLDKEKIKNYSEEDQEIIKDIFFFFC